MKLPCLLFAAISLSLSLTAQQQTNAGKGRITGRILDSLTQSPVEYATITLYVAGIARPVNGATTNNKGVFTIDGLPPGSYILTVGFIGYQPRSIDAIALTGKPFTLADILLTKKQEALQTVTVTASKGLVENKIDKMVYNAEKDITSQGGVATDILKKVPMVSVDVDGNVQLQGNSNVLFLINGKPSSIFGNNLADALQSIPASQIKNIEVITTPGARYDAEGTGGIINIVLKENRLRGINGNISLTAGTRLENGSLNLNARRGNFGLNAFFSGNAQLRSTRVNSSDRLSEDTATGTKDRLQQQGSSRFNRQGYESGLGFEWSIDHRNTLSGNIGYDNFGNRNNGSFLQQQTGYDPSGTPVSTFSSFVLSGSRFQGHSLDYSLSYKRTFAQEDRELNISYDGSYGNNHSAYHQAQSLPTGDSTFAGSNSNSDGHDHETNFRLDYVQPLSEKIKLETGGRIQIRQIASASSVYTLSPVSGHYAYDTGQSNALSYGRHVYAGYASLTFPIFNWLDVKGGLRYERTETDAVFSKSSGAHIPGYNTFAPSLILSHSFENDQTIKIAYTKRIQRPNYRWLNPYINASDPKNITTGNPYLQPEITHNIELTWSKSFEKGVALNVVLFYHHQIHDIQPFITYYPTYTIGDSVYTNTSVSIPMNVGAEDNYGLNVFGSVPLGPKVNIRSNLSFFDRYITTGALGGSNVTSFNYRLNMNATYQLSNTFVLEFFGNFNSRRNELQGRYPSFTTYNLAFRKQVWNKKGSIAFSATNPFAANVKQETSVTGGHFTLHSLQQLPYRSFGINFTYKFGKLEFKKDKEEPKELPSLPDNG
ncbi:MAG: TonB-dependent receptor [Chitinophagaceae bacterium]|nr:TonB-dependent receptor [Chitinophagaceae bacterium]